MADRQEMPEPGCGVTGSGDDAQSVGSRDQRDRRHEALVRFDPGEFIIGLGIPDPHRSISRPGDDDGAIRCHCHRGNRRLMPFKRVYFAARPHIPDARRLIKRAGNSAIVVEYCHRCYGRLMTPERYCLLVGCRCRRIPNSCRPVAGTGNDSPITHHGQCGNGVTVASDLDRLGGPLEIPNACDLVSGAGDDSSTVSRHCHGRDVARVSNLVKLQA